MGQLLLFFSLFVTGHIFMPYNFYCKMDIECKRTRDCYGLNGLLSPPNSYVEALTQNATLFGDRALKEVIKVKLSH